MPLLISPAWIWQQPAPESLAALWPQLAWRVAERGALLAVDAEAAPLLPGRALPPGRSHNPLEVLPLFDRMLVRLPTITAVASPTMRLYDPPRTPTGLAQALKDINPEPYTLLLLASLAGELRAQAVSPQGVPLTALDERQRRWLTGIAPEAVSFRLPQERDRALTAEDRGALHLRVRRTLELTALAEPEGETYALTGYPATVTVARSLPLLEPAPPLDPEADLLGRRAVPARLKPTELEPSNPALDPLVSLTGAATVGELVQRIARATHVSLFVHADLAPKKVWVKGEKARAGDVLAALCRGLSGTVRRLSDTKESVYLLVEDLPPAAVRRERATQDYLLLQGPIEQERRQLTALAAGARRRLIRGRELERLPRSEQDAPEALWKQAETFDTTGVPLAELTPRLRAELEATLQERLRLVEQFGGAVPRRPTKVTATLKLVLELVLPTVEATAPLAELDASSLRVDQPLPEPLPALRVPTACATRAWMVALPQEEKERTALIALAQSRGVTELRVPVPPGAEPEKALRALVADVQKASLGIVPVLCPLAPEDTLARRDRDAQGKTRAEWALGRPFAQLADTLFPTDALAPEAVDAAAFARRVARFAALPGVTGIGLEALAAPGYPDADPEDWPLWTGGYDPAQRVAFVKRYQLDPADLVAPTPFSHLLPGYKPDERREPWDKALLARRDTLMARLAHALEGTAKPLSVVASRWGQNGHWERWRGSFVKEEVRFDEAGERLPLVVRDAQPGLLHLRTLAYQARLTALDADLDSLLEEGARFRDWLDTELQEVLRPNPESIDRWQGFVLDVTDRPLAEALTLLEKAFAAKD